jgi:hypothetical protein
MSASDFGYQRIAHRFNQMGWNAVLVHLPFHYIRAPSGYLNGALAGEFDQIVPVQTLQRLAETWDVQNFEIVPQGHFGYVAMNWALRRLGLVLVLVGVLVLESGVATDLRCILA